MIFQFENTVLDHQGTLHPSCYLGIWLLCKVWTGLWSSGIDTMLKLSALSCIIFNTQETLNPTILSTLSSEYTDFPLRRSKNKSRREWIVKTTSPFLEKEKVFEIWIRYKKRIWIMTNSNKTNKKRRGKNRGQTGWICTCRTHSENHRLSMNASEKIEAGWSQTDHRH